MAFPTTGVLADFATNSGPPPTGFTSPVTDDAGAHNTLSATGGQLANSGGFGTAYYSAAAYSADMEAFYTVATKPGAGNEFAMYARINNAGLSTATAYYVQVNDVSGAGNDTIQIGRLDSGNVYTPLTPDPAATVEIAAGDKIGICVKGTGTKTIEAWHCPVSTGIWVLLASRTDATAAQDNGSRIGIEIQGATGRIDDFGGGQVVAGAPIEASMEWPRMFERKTHPFRFRPGSVPKHFELQDFDTVEVITGITYNETGELVAGTTFQGDDVFEAAETGSLTTEGIHSGADVFEASETGALTAKGTQSAADSFQPAETGALAAGALTSGADAFTGNRTGSITTAGLTSGASQKISAGKTGSIIAGTLTAGARALTGNRTGSLSTSGLLSGADSFQPAETGSIATSGLVSAGDAHTAAKTGALTPQAVLAGADAYTATETGTVSTQGLLSGVGQKSGTITKTGSLITGSVLAGVDAPTLNRTGSVTTGGLVSGARIREKPAKTGSLTTGALLSGADASSFFEAGSLTTAGQVRGADVATLNRTGAIYTFGRLSGVSLRVVFNAGEPVTSAYTRSGLFGSLTQAEGATGATRTVGSSGATSAEGGQGRTRVVVGSGVTDA